MSYKKAIYPGTFDPITNGHLDIIRRASKLYDELIVVVSKNMSKNILFSSQERYDMIKEVTKDISNVTVKVFEGLLIDFVKNEKCSVIIRGVRALTDFDYEFQMALINKRLENSIETLFMVTKDEYTFLSSSLVKELAKLNGEINGLVPEYVKECLISKFNETGR